MSKWFEAEDIDISLDGKEVHFYFGSDSEGNIYCHAKVEDIFKAISKQLADVSGLVNYQSQVKPIDTSTMFRKGGKK